MIISGEEIGALIPHAGTMRLLDGVLAWDETSIRCVSTQHRAPGNPLRQGDRLGPLSAIEFASQAMAVHGRLTGAVNERPRAGYLASLRQVVCDCERLDDVAGELIIEAKRLMGDHGRAMYAFSVSSGARQLVTGRAAVLLQPITPA
jgi:predicted hotdog family 3-hydroxylacyl-ACP dehydratase